MVGQLDVIVHNCEKRWINRKMIKISGFFESQKRVEIV